jgi:5-hydroxyisourate hydrolase
LSISTHVLDTSKGRPAAGVSVSLMQHTEEGSWLAIGSAITDQDGRVRELAPFALEAGTYRLIYDIAGYQRGGFFPEVVVTFAVTTSDGHLHVPLLLSPFGYSTYKGT